jgi:hypothetical protein
MGARRWDVGLDIIAATGLLLEHWRSIHNTIIPTAPLSAADVADRARKAAGSSVGLVRIWRLRKQSSGARLPSMLVRVSTRCGARSATSCAVRPPIEWPTT